MSPSLWLSVCETKSLLSVSSVQGWCGVFTVPVTLGQESLPHRWGEEVKNVRGSEVTRVETFLHPERSGHRPGMEGGLGLSERPFSKAGKDDKELFLEMGRA